MLKAIKEFTHVSNIVILGYSIMSIISGLVSFSFIYLVNSILEQIISHEVIDKNKFLLLFGLAIFLFFLTRRVLSGGIIVLSQKIYWNIRNELVNLVLTASFIKIQKKKDEIHSSLTYDVANITSGSLVIIEFISSAILIVTCFIYMAYVSVVLFIISLLVIILGAIIHFLRMKKSNRQFTITRAIEDKFIRNFNSVLNGIKEIKLNRVIGEKIQNEIETNIKDSKKNDVRAYVGYLNTQISGQLLFYVTIAFILIYASQLLDISSEIVVSFVFVLLYILGPIGKVLVIFPMLNRTLISFKKLLDLKKQLEEMQVVAVEQEVIEDFQKIEYKHLRFSYGENEFSIGPINLEINKGEIVFIQGENGSGKTTLMYSLLSIFKSNEGEVFLNNNIAPRKLELIVHKLFSPVFYDFYLFDKTYGIDKGQIKKANKYLKLFELDHLVEYSENQFSTIELSQGQRKRLALINAMLENKPIIVLDEWAADQDPEFRRKFYQEILPTMKDEGFTIIAITHDDKYFDSADKVVMMESGELRIVP
jgi:putative ATP-binding cassette transporter